MKKIVKLIVEIESDKDFDINELAVGKYFVDEAEEKKVFLTEGNISEDNEFMVSKYLKVEDITDKTNHIRKEIIATMYIEKLLNRGVDFEHILTHLPKHKQDSLQEQINNNI